MAVRAYSPVLPSVEVFGAYEGIASATGVNQKVSLTFTPTTGNLTIAPYDGDDNISQLQLEVASTPSSYIPTNSGATVTRAADTMTIPSANLPWPEPVVIGGELVTNGTFDTNLIGWDDAAGDWTWDASGRAYFNAVETSIQDLYQNLGLVIGDIVTVEFDYEVVAGALLAGLGNGTTNNAFIRNLVGSGTASFTQVITDNRWIGVYLNPENNSILNQIYVDNVTVKKINPLAVSIQMEGTMTYADRDLGRNTTSSGAGELTWYTWALGVVDFIYGGVLTVSSRTGQPIFAQRTSDSVFDEVTGSFTAYSPGINVPFNISSRHGSTFLNGAVDGVALTEDTTPVALPDLSATDMDIGSDFMGTIKLFRVWADDLTDAGIEEATLPSLEPSLSLTFDGSETSFTVLDWSA